MSSTVIEVLARKVDAYHNCRNQEWERKHGDAIHYIEKKFLPSGSGIDSGIRVILDESSGDSIVFHIPFHHMDEYGHYCGWVDYRATVTPSFVHGFNIDIEAEDDPLSADVSEFDMETMEDYLGETLVHSLEETVIQMI